VGERREIEEKLYGSLGKTSGIVLRA